MANPTNPIASLIDQLRGQMQQVAKRANDILATKPPLEQFEKTSPVYSALLNMGFALDFLTQVSTDILRGLDAIDPDAAINAGAEDVMKQKIEAGDLIPKAVLEEKITKGELLTKEVAQAAADTAAKTREQTVRDQLTKVEQRRKELSTPKSETEPALLSVDLSSRLSSELLAADDYFDRAKTVAARVKDLNDLGVEVPELMNSAAEIAVDEAGNKLFSERLSLVKSIAAKANPGTVVREPFAGGGGHQENQGAHDLAASF